MLNNKNEVISVLPIQNVNGGYIKKTYAELIEEISPDEIDKLYSYFEQFTDKNIRFNEYNIRVETVTFKSWQSRMDLT